MYYAANIKGGSNTITMSFNQAAPYVDMNTLEYKGINTLAPLDIIAGASGSGTSASIGSATMTVANELIMVADTENASAASGFVLRIITLPNYDLVEDGTASQLEATAPPHRSRPAAPGSYRGDFPIPVSRGGLDAARQAE